jgi:plastocyanin domain-containing protein
MNDKINNKGKISKTTIILGVAAFVVIAVFGFISASALSGGEKTTNTGNTATSENIEEVQTAVLQYTNYEYKLTPNTLKKGVPVKITVDTNTVVGCMRDIVISDFGVRKRVTPTDNIIEFTPDKDGTFWIVCSMNMGRGTFSVSSDGTMPTGSLSAPTSNVAAISTATSSPSPAGTCGMTTGTSGGAKTGGCGCGMR